MFGVRRVVVWYVPGGGGDYEGAVVWAVAGFVHADEDCHSRSIVVWGAARSVAAECGYWRLWFGGFVLWGANSGGFGLATDAKPSGSFDSGWLVVMFLSVVGYCYWEITINSFFKKRNEGPSVLGIVGRTASPRRVGPQRLIQAIPNSPARRNLLGFP